MRAVWPGTTVEEKNLTVQISALRRALDEDRPGESCIQTVPSRGYRLVRATPEHPPPAPAPASDTAQSILSKPLPLLRRRITGWVTAALAAFALLAVATLLTLFLRHTSLLRHPDVTAGPATPPRLSIVVLPFQNLGGDRGEDYLADAITDDLTTDLSRLPGTFVIARQSAYTYQGRTVDIRHIGEELGVRYALEGSVRKLGDVLRVNAQLIDTETGAHIWADRFDEQLADLSAGQEQVASRIGRALNPALLQAESARGTRERPTNPNAFDLILRARSIGMHVMGRREHAQRLDLFEQALQRDPTSLLAMIGVAGELGRRALQSDLGGDLSRAARLAADAAAINPNHPLVLDTMGWLAFVQGRYPEAIAAYQRLLDLYPNTQSAHNQIALSLIYLGRAKEAVPMMETVIRRDQRSPYLYSRYDTMSYALLMLGRDEEALTWTRSALATLPEDYVPHRSHLHLRLGAALARLGRLDEAHREIAEANRLWPYDTVRSHWPEDPTNPTYVAQIERFQAALRLAGHRDHAEEDADPGPVSDATLRENLAGLTPATVTGAKTIRTAELAAMLAGQDHLLRKLVVIDPMLYSWGRSIPGAIGLSSAGVGGPRSDIIQERLRRKMHDLTGGDLATPVIVIGFNAERFDGPNLASQLVTLGYTDVHWYRGGREAWEVAGLPETEADIQDW